jgi:hypothetical protein
LRIKNKFEKKQILSNWVVPEGPSQVRTGPAVGPRGAHLSPLKPIGQRCPWRTRRRRLLPGVRATGWPSRPAPIKRTTGVPMCPSRTPPATAPPCALLHRRRPRSRAEPPAADSPPPSVFRASEHPTEFSMTTSCIRGALFQCRRTTGTPSCMEDRAGRRDLPPPLDSGHPLPSSPLVSNLTRPPRRPLPSPQVTRAHNHPERQ